MDIGALILMGGKNSRMNGNVKGLLKIKNSTFLEKIQETLNDFSSIYLSINDKFSKEQKQNFENMGFKIIEDIYLKTMMRPQTWEVCRSLWHTTFANEHLKSFY